jgi:hypothetical protein
MFCPVSRAAVYRRLQEGKLSIFLFHVTHKRTSLFGKSKTLRSSPFGYVPVSEVLAWKEELEERAVRQGAITREELEGAKPDWEGEFLHWRDRSERLTLFDLVRQDDTKISEIVGALGLGLVEAGVSKVKSTLGGTGGKRSG